MYLEYEDIETIEVILEKVHRALFDPVYVHQSGPWAFHKNTSTHSSCLGFECKAPLAKLHEGFPLLSSMEMGLLVDMFWETMPRRSPHRTYLTKDYIQQWHWGVPEQHDSRWCATRQMEMGGVQIHLRARLRENYAPLTRTPDPKPQPKLQPPNYQGGAFW